MSADVQANGTGPRLAANRRGRGDADMPRGDRLRRRAPADTVPELTDVGAAVAPDPIATAPAPEARRPEPPVAPPAVAGNAAQLPVRRGEVARGLRYLHDRASAATGEILWLTASLQATVEALQRSGHVDSAALERRRDELSGELADAYGARGMGVNVDTSGRDKYAMPETVEIDCDSRLHLCKAACCKLHFALSRQDVDEGLVRWEFGQPYLIAQGADGYCVHADRATLRCGLHAHRPATCRAYDCRNDTRIWLDFDRRLVNPALADPDWPGSPAAGQAGADAGGAGGIAASPAAASVARRAGLWERLGMSLLRGLAPLLEHPILARRGRWLVTTYGVLVGLALGSAVFLSLWLVAVRFQQPLPAPGHAIGMVVAAFIGSWCVAAATRAGARLLREPRVPKRGHILAGGLVVGGAYIAFFFGEPGHFSLLFLDCAAPGAALGYGLGKIACLANGCCVGRPTDHRLAVRYRHENTKAVAHYGLRGVGLIPVQLLEVAWGSLLLLVLLLLPAGIYGLGGPSGVFLAGFAIGRLLLERLRFQPAGEVAYPRIAVALNVALLVAGSALVTWAVAQPAAAPAALAASGASVPWPTLAAAALLAGAAGVLLYGVHRLPRHDPAPVTATE